MKPHQPYMISSSRNYITVGWDTRSSVILRETDEEPGEEGNKEWYILEKKDRVLGWCRVYMGFKSQAEIGPLAPSDYYELRLKVTSGLAESDWSDTLFAVTKDDIVPVAQLHRAVENGPVNTLRRILGQRPSSVDIPNKFGQTPLTLTILKNNTNFMGILLNQGACVDNTEPGSGRTPLMLAAQRGQIEAVQLLLEKGSSWEKKDRNGLTALNYAVDNSHIEIVDLALKDGADIKVKDKFGWTPFMRGVTLKSSLKVLTYLLDNGSNPNEADDRNQTVLMQAVLSGRPEIVELILLKGADINIKNIYGHSAYDMAKTLGNEGILKLAHLLGGETDEDLKNKRKKKVELKRN